MNIPNIPYLYIIPIMDLSLSLGIYIYIYNTIPIDPMGQIFGTFFC